MAASEDVFSETDDPSLDRPGDGTVGAATAEGDAGMARTAWSAGQIQ